MTARKASPLASPDEVFLFEVDRSFELKDRGVVLTAVAPHQVEVLAGETVTLLQRSYSSLSIARTARQLRTATC